LKEHEDVCCAMICIMNTKPARGRPDFIQNYYCQKRNEYDEPGSGQLFKTDHTYDQRKTFKELEKLELHRAVSLRV
jgi:hypothetical protein